MNEPEPSPIHNDATPVWETVIAEMHERNRIGTEQYRTPLQPFNGRRALIDAYQELLDLVVYMRQELTERAVLAAELFEFADSLRDESPTSLEAHYRDTYEKIMSIAQKLWPSAR